MKRKHRKPEPLRVAIIGPSAPTGARSLYGRNFECWALNAAYHRACPDPARVFNLHRYAHLERDVPQYVDWDTTFSRRNPQVPIYVIDSWNGLLKNQVIFPRAALEAMPRGAYHASSFDMLVAYAISLKASHIHIHGAAFAVEGPGQEPISARACLEYWCGYAQGLGIDVAAGADCTGLFQQFHLTMSDSFYGYDDVHMIEERRTTLQKLPDPLRSTLLRGAWKKGK